MKPLTAGEYGFLLLTSHLGDPGRKPLTVAQFRELTERWKYFDYQDISRDMDEADFVSVGYSNAAARQIVDLLNDKPRLDRYILRAQQHGCVPITRASEEYPLIVRKRLGLDSPGCLWVRGDLSVLNSPAISLVGSRELRERNRDFAEEVGRHAAQQGLTLVSGNARGADKAAQDACLMAGGKVISVVADSLLSHRPKENVLYVSELGFDEEFTSQRALSRNRVIHALGRMVFVAQADLHKGGTWNGTAKNLHNGWSPVVCFRDGSVAMGELEKMGAYQIGKEELKDFCGLHWVEPISFDI